MPSFITNRSGGFKVFLNNRCFIRHIYRVSLVGKTQNSQFCVPCQEMPFVFSMCSMSYVLEPKTLKLFFIVVCFSEDISASKMFTKFEQFL